jgi:hypothetical protein
MRLSLPLILTVLTLNVPVWAGETPDQTRTDRIVFGLADYNPADTGAPAHNTAVRAELRLATIPVWKFHPWLGAETGSHGMSWAGAGLETDIDLSKDWGLTLQAGAGYFDDGTRHKHYNLNPPAGFEFRDQIEVSYKIADEGARVGLSWSHISNAGLRTENPGINAIGLNVHVPMPKSR